jgi:hypothetical protein
LKNIEYALACVVLPAIWGLVAAWVYDRIAALRAKHRPDQVDSADMYHI